MNNIDHIQHRIKESGLKVTQQRLVIYTALLGTKSHPTTESIYEDVKQNNPSISLGTVYKTLETFVEFGLAKKVMTEDGIMRYDGYVHSHHHIYCTNTKEIIDYEDENLMLLIKNYLEEKKINNLKIDQISVQINGQKLSLSENVVIN